MVLGTGWLLALAIAGILGVLVLATGVAFSCTAQILHRNKGVQRNFPRMGQLFKEFREDGRRVV